MIPLFSDLPTELEEAVSELHEVDGWPVDYGKDAELVNRLTKLYPNVDLRKEAGQWKIWLIEHESRKRTNWRRRFANWVRKADEFATERRSRSYRTHHTAEIEGHGETVAAREEW